ncbi:IS1182 family transposase [Clostridium tyrobutyricum]|uniref:IS1182 family transposase n=1 Tax=Clostridium tyrobutyricum TaxID=1519 RepID=UPI0010AB2664|nr:IS1182 family transposase [Clostridium tyrobutyricum]QCH26990.1 Transposase DDE domain protein [Clostridium tyrobutyricum]
MLTKRGKDIRAQVELYSLEDLVPKDHLLRKIDKAINFNFIYNDVEELYSDFGRPSIDPVVLIKIVVIQYIFGIPSMRQTIRDIQVNMAYRWFLGYSISEKIPHFSTFNKNYERRFKNTEIFTNIFIKILDLAEKQGFLAAEQVYIDSTHIKASANKKKFKRVNVKVEAKKYKNKLDKEIDADRQHHGKKPLKKTEKIETKEVVQSTTDKESGMFYKNEKEKCFAYLAHTACDDANFILDFEVTTGNVHDSVAFYDLYNKVYSRFGDKMFAVAIDAGYKNPSIAKTILDSGILPSMPYKRPMTKKGFFKKYEYVYDEYNDCYICPNNKILKYSTTNREGYKEYKSNCCDCKNCDLISKCTNSKNKQKLVVRHVWENYLEEADHLRHEKYVKCVYKRRKETIERVFADAKEKHGFRFTHLRSLAKMKMEVTLTFACMNLKKLANKLWKRRLFLLVFNKIHFQIQIFFHYNPKAIFSKMKIWLLSTV